MQITVQTLVNAPIADVWRACTTPEDIEHWDTASEPEGFSVSISPKSLVEVDRVCQALSKDAKRS